MINTNNLKICFQSWDKAQPFCYLIREKVFINEQRVSPQLEWDKFDLKAIHGILSTNNLVIGCARIVTANGEVKLERMAILKNYRLKGFGSFFLNQIILYIKNEISNTVHISAQVSAIPFYKKHGFKITSKTYIEVGIKHQAMTLDITQ